MGGEKDRWRAADSERQGEGGMEWDEMTQRRGGTQR